MARTTIQKKKETSSNKSSKPAMGNPELENAWPGGSAPAEALATESNLL